MTKRLIAALLALLLLAGVAACGTSTPDPQPPADGAGSGDGGSAAPAGPQQGGTLVVAMGGNPQTFNPNAKADDFGIFIAQNVFNKLVTLDVDYNVIPDLAKEWTVSDDGLVYTFTLESGVKWHDGEPLTAADVKWTYEAILANQGIAAGNIASIASIEAPADDTVVITLSEPNAALLPFLGWFGIAIMPQHIYGDSPDWLDNPANEQPIGTGPYKLESFRHDDQVVLVRNDDYFRGAPALEKIIFSIIPDANTAVQAFLANEVDVMLMTPPLAQIPILQNTPGVEVDIWPMPNRYYLPFNLGHEALAKVEVRQAIAHAISRDDILNKALKGIGEANDGFYTPAIGWAFNDQVHAPAHDPARAESLLDAAGYAKGADGVRMKLQFVYFQGEPWGDIAAVIKDNLADVGIDVELVQLDQGAWFERVVGQGDYDLTLLAGQQGPDPDGLRLRFGTGGMLNMMGYSNPAVDEALARGVQVAQEERADYYFEAQALLAQDLPFVPLAEMVAMSVHRDFVKGLPHQQGTRGTVGEWVFEATWLDQ